MRTLRPAVPVDAPTLAALLRAEGLPDDAMAFARWQTYVMEEGGAVMGFLTLATAHGLPMLVHFVLGRVHRTPPRVRFLVCALRLLVREAGFASLIVHACGPRERRLIEYYWRAWPYALDHDRAWYRVPA